MRATGYSTGEAAAKRATGYLADPGSTEEPMEVDQGKPVIRLVKGHVVGGIGEIRLEGNFCVILGVDSGGISDAAT